jgi:hypothetical protein
MEQSNGNDQAPTNAVVDCTDINVGGHPPHPGLGQVKGWFRLKVVKA